MADAAIRQQDNRPEPDIQHGRNHFVADFNDSKTLGFHASEEVKHRKIVSNVFTCVLSSFKFDSSNFIIAEREVITMSVFLKEG